MRISVGELKQHLNSNLHNLLDQDSYEVSDENAIDMLCTERFDIIAKIIYIKYSNRNLKNNFSEILYLNHIKALNNFVEYDRSGKIGKEEFVKTFDKLLKDRENRPFLDVLYHQKGLFYDKMNLDEQAKKYYNKSIKSFTNDGYLISSNYRNLGEIHFDNAEYKKAGMYYDSTLLRLNERTREYRQIKKKRDNLEEVIKYEEIAKANDSILSIVAMNDKARITYFENYIEKLKIQDAEKERLAKEKAEKEANILANTSPGGINPPSGGILPPGKILNQSDIVPLDKPQSGPKNANQSAFYFYNPVTVNYGKREFISKWGNRQLVENWRVAASTKNVISAKDDNENDLVLSDSITYLEGIDTRKILKNQLDIPSKIVKIDIDKVVVDNLEYSFNDFKFKLKNWYNKNDIMAILILPNDKSQYKNLVEIISEIYLIVETKREEYSKKKYEANFKNLDSDKKKTVMELYPLVFVIEK